MFKPVKKGRNIKPERLFKNEYVKNSFFLDACFSKIGESPQKTAGKNRIIRSKIMP